MRNEFTAIPTHHPKMAPAVGKSKSIGRISRLPRVEQELPTPVEFERELEFWQLIRKCDKPGLMERETEGGRDEL